MTWLVPNYVRRTSWGHTVSLKDPYADHKEFGRIVDSESVNAIFDWVMENSNGTRISYDTWKFKTKQEADEFVMLFTLRYGK